MTAASNGESGVPRPIESVSLAGMNLSAEEGFVWSRVDGVVGVDEICMLTGFGRDKITAILAHLADLGLVSWKGENRGRPATTGRSSAANPKSAAAESSPAPNADEVRLERQTGPTQDFAERHPTVPQRSKKKAQTRQASSGEWDTGELEAEEGVDLSLERRKAIRSFHSRLDEMSFYEALGVEMNADEKAILRAYKRRSLKFHPDRHFGKELGEYKELLEETFKFLTKVKDFLLDPEKRRFYDENQLKEQEFKRAVDHAQRMEENELGRAAAQPPDAQGRAAAGGQETRPAANRDSREQTQPFGSPASSAARRSKPQRPRHRNKSRLRIRALAAQLGAQGQQGAHHGQPRTDGSRVAGEAPKRPRHRPRRTSRLEIPAAVKGMLDGRKAKAKKHFDEGVKKLLDEQFISAATSLKLATVYDPNNEEYAKKYKVAAERAGELIALQHYNQAKFQRSVGRWEAASRALVQAADHHPVVCYQMEAAEALLHVGELRRAQQYAIKATESDPQNADARLTLAKVYMEAEMYLNARREAEAALKIDPGHDRAKSILREIRKAL
jgi:curved DNA-binding protein CbpA